MKQIVRTLAAFAFAACATQVAQAQCTPNLGYTTPGFYPSSLPNPMVNVPYGQTIDFKFPATYNYNGFNVNIDSVKVNSISNLPPGLSYTLNKANGLYLGGENGCARFSGTVPQGSAGAYQILIKVTGYAKFVGVVFPIQQADSIDLYVDYALGISSVGSASLHCDLYPNPADGQTTLARGNAKEAATLTLVDGTGRLAYTKKMPEGMEQIQLPTSDLAAGLYHVLLTTTTTHWTGTLSVAR